jgi:UDP-MurNAc hydroxylase
MRITCLGHAGLFIETSGGTILCDPWKNPAYFDSWFVFPDNSDLDWDRYGRADYLYVSHLHKDHFDPRNLREHVSRDATVLLPDYPVPELRAELEKLGFTRFVVMPSGKEVELGGVRVMVQALASPADDSGVRPLRRALSAVLRGDLVSVDLRAARGSEAVVRRDQAGQRHGPCRTVRQSDRCHVCDPVRGAAVFPGR